MGYGDYARHLMDQDPWPAASYSDWPQGGIALGVPARPSAPPSVPDPRPYGATPDAYEPVVPPAAILPHQRRMGVLLARDHGKQFKVQLHALYLSDAPNVREVVRLLDLGRRWWHALLLQPRTVGLVLSLSPTRVVITPEGFFTMAKAPWGRKPGRLAPLCSADFGSLGTAPDFLTQVHAELNSIVRRRAEVWRELGEFVRPKKSLHTCRTM